MTDDPTRNWLDTELAAAPEPSVVFRVLQGLALALPAAPPVTFYGDLEAGLVAGDRSLTEAALGFARGRASDSAVREALYAGKSLDTGDAGFTVLTGLRTALALFMGWEIAGLSRDQQRVDAAAKALGIGLLAFRLFDGDAAARVDALRSVPEGRTLLLTWAAVEVALPFGSEIDAANGTFVQSLIANNLGAVRRQLARIVDASTLEQAEATLVPLAVVLDQLVSHARPRVQGVADTLTHTLPRIDDPEQIASVTALVADTLPLYRLLTARLAVGRSWWLAAGSPGFASPLDPGVDPFLMPLERPFQPPPDAPAFADAPPQLAATPTLVADATPSSTGPTIVGDEEHAPSDRPASSLSRLADRHGTLMPPVDDGE